ncbi:hypothetical protein [Bacillus sp. 1P06AnD]|uniref:hypothetical protein n=1 Tax=Bacillus sp. 1P06AnD TaxID=3132208 RepID=UPI0039A1AA8A
MELSTIFLIIFISTIAFLFLNMLLGDIFNHAIGLDHDFFNMTTFLCFIGVTSAIGYLLEKFSTFSFPIMVTLVISGGISLILTVILNIFVFIPLSKMESTTGYRLEDMGGQIGEVTLTIPPEEIGEIMISLPTGSVVGTARSFKKNKIEQGEKVLVMFVEDSIYYVQKYDPYELGQD